MRNARNILAITLALALVTTTEAIAHTGAGVAGGLLSGFGHPLSGWDHIVAMIAVGLWGAQLGSPGIFLLPIAFPLMMAVGGFMGLMGMPLPSVEVGIAASAIVLGLAVAFEARPALWVSMALVAIFAVFHGYAHGAELEEGANPLAYSLGFVAATGLLHALGILIGELHRWKIGERTVQALGAAVAIAGVRFLYQAVA
jgi:urease accessory protein